MFKKVKRSLVNSMAPKKAFLGFLIFLLLFSSLFPSRYFLNAQGALSEKAVDSYQWLKDFYEGFSDNLSKSYTPSSVISSITGPFIAIPAALIGGVFWVLAVMTGGLKDLAILLLQWVLSGQFLGDVSYTNPRNNPVIAEGLKVTQSFVNMILVIVLVFISLSTILRYKEYEARKLLVNFVIIALLVNFAPVICGLIVDASNITMNFFLQGIKGSGSSLSNSLTAPMDAIKTGWNWQKMNFDLQAISNFATQTVAMTIVNFFSFFVYLAFAVVFIVRYMAIWVLVILSPIAFACYVLPNTRKYWTQWWAQFTQWCIIGITCSFFLHLAETFMTKQGVMIKSDFLKANEATIGASILLNFVPVIFLALALYMGLQTSAMGASSILGWSTKARKASSKYLTRATAGRFLASEMGKKISTGLSRIPSITETGQGRGTLGKWALRAGALAMAPLTVPARVAGRAALSYGAAQGSQIEERKKKLENEFGKDYKRAAATYSSILPGDWQSKAALARYLVETKGAKALDELSEFQKQDLIKTTAKYDPAKLEDIAKFMPNMIDDPYVGKIIKAKVAKNTEELVAKMKPDDYKNITREMLEDKDEKKNEKLKEYRNAIISKAMGSHIKKLEEGSGRESMEILEKQIRANAAEAKQQPGTYLKNTNVRLYKFLTEGEGASLMDIPKAEDEKTDDTKKEPVITPGAAATSSSSYKGSATLTMKDVAKQLGIDTSQKDWEKKYDRIIEEMMKRVYGGGSSKPDIQKPSGPPKTGSVRELGWLKMAKRLGIDTSQKDWKTKLAEKMKELNRGPGN